MAVLIRLIAAFMPVGLLLVLMLVFRWNSLRAGAMAFAVASLLAVAVFGGGMAGLVVAWSKGLALALFILLIIWSSVFLYHVVLKAGGMNVIAGRFSEMPGSKLERALLLAWVFSGFLQGVAGFGVPVAIVAPLIAALGIAPIQAVAATLIGHCWAVTFGSMGSSFFTIQMILKLPGPVLAHWTTLFLALPVLLTGAGVCYTIAGWKGLKSALFPVLATAAVMAFVQWFTATRGMYQIGAFSAGLAGILVMAVLLRIKSGRDARWDRPAAGGTASEEAIAGRTGHAMPFYKAFSPYSLLIVLMMILQLPAIKKALSTLKFGWSFPASVTGLGFRVPAETMYAVLSLASHPAPYLILSAVFGIFAFHLGRQRLAACVTDTVRQCMPTTLTTALLLMMALTMNDTGMTTALASGIAAFSGRVFPFFSSFIGALGCFLTGSNTSSNVLFGVLQAEAAQAIQAAPPVVAAAQTTGGSVGSAIAPAKVLLGTATLALAGKESAVLRICMWQTAVILGFLGLMTMILAFL